jgi:hypothetical protein
MTDRSKIDNLESRLIDHSITISVPSTKTKFDHREYRLIPLDLSLSTKTDKDHPNNVHVIKLVTNKILTKKV